MVEPGLELRLLGPKDASALAALEAQVFADAWDAEHFRALLGQDRFVAVGAFDHAGLCAYLTAYSVAGELEIVNVAVAAELRGQGIGRSLLLFFWSRGDCAAQPALFLRSAAATLLPGLFTRAAVLCRWGCAGRITPTVARMPWCWSGRRAQTD